MNWCKEHPLECAFFLWPARFVFSLCILCIRGSILCSARLCFSLYVRLLGFLHFRFFDLELCTYIASLYHFKRFLCGEVELRNRHFQESHAKNCQQSEELRRICCEGTDRARQAGIDELSVHQKRDPTTLSQFLTQIQDLQNKVNS